MSDLVPRLRTELLEAHARYGKRPRAYRAARHLDPRTWQPAAVPAALATAAAVVAVVLAIGAVSPPWPAGGRPHVAAEIAVGGVPQDAVAGAGALWIADFDGTVVRVDARRRRVAARIDVGGNPTSIAFGAGAVWVMATEPNGRRSHIERIDPHSNRVVAVIPISGGGSSVAAGPAGVWVIHTHTPPAGIEQIDPARNRVARHIPFLPGAAIDVGGDTVWATANNATVAEIDAVTGRVEHRWENVAPGTEGSDGDNGTIADPGGAWTIDAPDALLKRLVGGQVARRLRLPPGSLSVIGRTDDVLWTADGRDLEARYRLRRIDPDSGSVTATVELADHKPLALIPVGDDLFAVAADGTARVIRP